MTRQSIQRKIANGGKDVFKQALEQQLVLMLSNWLDLHNVYSIMIFCLIHMVMAISILLMMTLVLQLLIAVVEDDSVDSSVLTTAEAK